MDRLTEFQNSRRAVVTGLALAGGAAALLPATVSADPVPFALPPATQDITPFKAAIPEAALDDLKRRLGATRFPDRETVRDWSQGVPLERMRDVVQYWHRRYDWRRGEQKLNAFPQFRTQIDGVGIHFLHVRSKHENALPIILTHGWPGSIFEFLKVIRPLVDPTAHGGKADDAFHVVVPSLPGFAFSDKPTEKGWNVVRIAHAWAALMKRLGYSRWVAQGGDWGGSVTTALGHIKPDGLVAIHLNWPPVFPKKVPTEGLTPDEQRAVAELKAFTTRGFGYYIEQGTRPQTIGYGLADSPVGQAAWIYEKFQDWTDNNGDVESVLSRDEILDDISLYWLTDAAASSARIYWEDYPVSFSGGRVDLPVAVSIFPKERYQAPRTWAEQDYPQLIYWNELPRGGHFAAFEQPELFVSEMRAAFVKLRKS